MNNVIDNCCNILQPLFDYTWRKRLMNVKERSLLYRSITFAINVSVCLIKKQISSSNELLNNNSLFGCQLWRRSNHEREARVIYVLTTDRQAVNCYSSIHALELNYSNTQETMKKQLYPSDSYNFPPFNEHWRNPAKGLTVTQASTCSFCGF